MTLGTTILLGIVDRSTSFFRKYRIEAGRGGGPLNPLPLILYLSSGGPVMKALGIVWDASM